MTQEQRLGAWGWFARAFAAGFGAMCGVMVAAAIAACTYCLLTAGVMTIASSNANASYPALPAPQYVDPGSATCRVPCPPPVQAAGYFVMPHGVGANAPVPIEPPPAPDSPVVPQPADSEAAPDADEAEAADQEDSPR